MMARSENYEVSAELLAYLIGADHMDAEMIAKAQDQVRKYRADDWVLPDPVV